MNRGIKLIPSDMRCLVLTLSLHNGLDLIAQRRKRSWKRHWQLWTRNMISFS
jgi:hypothetical protein